MVADTGAYTYVCEEDELEQYTDQAAGEKLIARFAIQRVEQWMELADERLSGTGIQCLMAPGNDDMEGVEAAIEQSESIVNPDGRKLELITGHEFVATGYSNVTPWFTERELEEDELERLMADLFEQLKISIHRRIPARAAVRVGHRLGPRSSDDLQIQTRGGEPDMVRLVPRP